MLRGFNIIRRMATQVIPEVDIDANGTFKYILLKISITDNTGTSESKNIVRGYAECPYHTDINDKITDQLQKMKSDEELTDWQTKVLGGGRIDHDAAAKTIKVYGFSQGYGKADHQVTVDLIKKFYPDYASITWSDEGY